MLRFKKANNKTIEVDISTQTFIKVAILIIAMLILIVIFRKISYALLLIFVSFFLALALNAPVQAVSRLIPGKLKGNRSLATSLSFLIVITIIGIFLAYVIPPLVHQTETFIGAAPRLISDFNNQTGAIGEVIRRYHLSTQVNDISRQLSNRLHNVGGVAFSAITDIGRSIFAIVTVLVLTFMMLIEGPGWMKKSQKMIPSQYHDLIVNTSIDMYKVIKGYINGQVLLALIAAILISPMVFILHFSYPIALIVVIFICGLIPMIGHTIGAVIVTTVGLFHSFSSGLIILIYYILYQQFENYLLQPKIQANSTNMSPLLVFGSLVVGIDFGGLIGGLIAIPLVGCLRILVLEIFRMYGLISKKEFTQIVSVPDSKIEKD
ncbi:MAG: AI-2E family transporter [Patescibacteria group bacterium]|jgi:predicted PurR-regulated permease PerM|nr:AI-2E family transporter [Patescibacteria group bacterium]